MKKVYYLVPLLLSCTLLCTACEKDKPVVKKQEEVYDWHNEKYQDFYSQYMRKQTLTKNDHVNYSFDSQDIERTLNIRLDKPVQGLLNITRVEPQYNSNREDNYFKNEKDIWEIYTRKGEIAEYEPCKSEIKIDGLFCINKPLKNETKYYYFPNSSKPIANINQSIIFRCEKLLNNNYSCTLTNLPNSPYNLNIWILFSNPRNFFYIISYVENHIYQTTGQHIWQTLPKQN